MHVQFGENIGKCVADGAGRPTRSENMGLTATTERLFRSTIATATGSVPETWSRSRAGTSSVVAKVLIAARTGAHP
jgi:hypothetical protein